MAENYGKILYLNTSVGEYIERRTVKPSDASTEVARSGPLLTDPHNYVVAVFRTVVPFRTPTWIPELDLSVGDGLTTPYSISLRAVIGGTVYRGREFLKLIKDPAEVVAYASSQPDNGYTYVGNIADAAEILNRALQGAYSNLIGAGAALNPDHAPYFSTVPGSANRLRISAYPFSLWETKESGFAGDHVEIFFNEPAEFLASGWPYKEMRRHFETPSPDGEDNKILLYGDGQNHEGTGSTVEHRRGLAPADPDEARIFLEQSEGSAFPTIDRVILGTSLPIVPEATGAEGSGRDQVLTDFAPDPTVRGKRLQIFNASFGNARWHSLSGSGPISSFRLSFSLRQWNGIVVDDNIDWKGGEPSVKLCFAPRNMAP